MKAIERVRELVEPIVRAADLDLYDLEHESGILRVVIDKPGGVDVDTIGSVASAVSDALDEADPIPDSRYLLEVTSPGIERKLRVPAHFEAQIGNEIAIKVKRNVEGERRFDARLIAAHDTTIEVAVPNKEEDVARTVAYDDIESARLIYRWEDEVGKKHNSITTKKASAR